VKLCGGSEGLLSSRVHKGQGNSFRLRGEDEGPGELSEWDVFTFQREVISSRPIFEVISQICQNWP